MNKLHTHTHIYIYIIYIYIYVFIYITIPLVGQGTNFQMYRFSLTIDVQISPSNSVGHAHGQKDPTGPILALTYQACIVSGMQPGNNFWDSPLENPRRYFAGYIATSKYGSQMATELPGCSVQNQIWRTKQTKVTKPYLAAMQLKAFTQGRVTLPRGFSRDLPLVARQIHTCKEHGNPPKRREPARIRRTY